MTDLNMFACFVNASYRSLQRWPFFGDKFNPNEVPGSRGTLEISACCLSTVDTKMIVRMRVPFLYRSYSLESILTFNDTRLESAEGIQQSDPLGPFCSSLYVYKDSCLIFLRLLMCGTSTMALVAPGRSQHCWVRLETRHAGTRLIGSACWYQKVWSLCYRLGYILVIPR